MRAQESTFELPASRYLKSGEFAALCHTTKETLRHYRQIGLLEPARIAGNGYGLYSPLQLGDYLLISSLQKAGSSLDAIKDYLESPQDDGLAAIVEAHIDKLKDERKRLLAQQRFLEETLKRHRMLESWKGNEAGWRIVEADEERFAETDLSAFFADDGLDPQEEAELTGRLIEGGIPSPDTAGAREMQGCYRVGLAALQAGTPETDFHFCTRLPGAKARRADHVKPAGTYFQRLRSTSIDAMLASGQDLFATYRTLLEEVAARGFAPIGDVYEQELSLYTGDIAATVYTEISIRIAPES